MIKPFALDNVREAQIEFDPMTKTYNYANPDEEGQPPFERCVEVPWVHDRLEQAFSGQSPRWPHKLTLFDFGCNKAEYIREAKQAYGLRTFGIDMKRPGKNFVDRFFQAEFDHKVARRIQRHGPFDVCTAISAIEHAGCLRHPDAAWITGYQMQIVQFLIDTSKYCFISVPFGQRPGWAEDESRKNFYQFDPAMLASIEEYAKEHGKNYMHEIYKLELSGIWVQSNIASAENCIYRDNRGGASAIALISIWGNDAR